VGESAGIIGLATGDHPAAELGQRADLLFSRGFGPHPDGPPGAAPACQFGYRRDRGPGIAETVHQLAKRDRTDVFRPDQTQPFEALIVA
jgi:hypothetical protein